jgi:hypothetical protein
LVVVFQDERGHLEWIAQITGEAPMVLAGHDPVESVGQSQSGLQADLPDDVSCPQLVVGV